jgi:Domain of Unknown Function (DUF1540)
MKMTIDMPSVTSCRVEECVYNRERMCHARAITVGDPEAPRCDTFMESQCHCQGGEKAGVGACKVDWCTHNDDFECQTDSVNIGQVGSDVMCMTCKKR